MTEPTIQLPPGPRGPLSYSSEQFPPIGKKKIFTKPFRLVFKRTEDQAVTWIEVKSADGLKTVIERLAKAELVPVNACATLSLQLWALLAEHIGFLRYSGPDGYLNAGIEPLGAEQADLVGDMTELFGGFDPALAALSEMRDDAVREWEKSEGPSILKGDGVNLTPEGEKLLASEVYDTVGDSNVDVKMETANAEVLLQDTEAEEIEDEDRVLFTEELSQAVADRIGEKVQRAAEGDLEDEEEVDG